MEFWVIFYYDSFCKTLTVNSAANLGPLQHIQGHAIIVLAVAKTFNSDFCRQVTNALY